MITKFLGKIADLPKVWAAVYIIGLVLCYIAGMVLVILGVTLVDAPHQFIVPALFWPGIAIWVPTCVLTILTSISSNFSSEVKKVESHIDAITHNHH